MSLALYRTYRPGDFAAVIGQEHVTGPLIRALDSDRIHHAYLFTGPRGCGKTSSARIMARSMNCAEGISSTPCGTCQSCVDLAPNGPGSIDVIEIDAATYRGIEDAKELREKAIYAPVNSRYKVYIIDEAHQLTRDAFNVLLKLVEEPPPHLRFIFATTEPDKIIPTLRSRTHHYPFRLVSARTLQEHLAKVCAQEIIPADPAALTMIARAGAGSVRDSLSVLGQAIAGSGPEGVTYAETVAQLGFTDDVLLSQFIQAIATGDGAGLFTLVDQVATAGHEPRRFVTDLLERLRDLLIITQVPDAASSGLFDMPAEQLTDLVGQAKLFTPAQLVRVADLVSAGLSELRGANAPRLQLELLVARLVTPEVTEDLADRVAKLEAGGVVASARPSARAATAAQTNAATPAEPVAEAQPESRLPQYTQDEKPLPPREPVATKSATSRPAPLKPSQVKGTTPTAPATPVAETESSAPAAQQSSTPTASLENVRNSWPAVLETLKDLTRVGWMVAQNTTPLSLADDGVLAIAIKDQGTASGFAKHAASLEKAIQQVMGIKVRIDAIVDPGKAPSNSVKAQATAEVGDASPEDETLRAQSAVDLVANAFGATVISETPLDS